VKFGLLKVSPCRATPSQAARRKGRFRSCSLSAEMCRSIESQPDSMSEWFKRLEARGSLGSFRRRSSWSRGRDGSFVSFVVLFVFYAQSHPPYYIQLIAAAETLHSTRHLSHDNRSLIPSRSTVAFTSPFARAQCFPLSKRPPKWCTVGARMRYSPRRLPVRSLARAFASPLRADARELQQQSSWMSIPIRRRRTSRTASLNVRTASKSSPRPSVSVFRASCSPPSSRNSKRISRAYRRALSCLVTGVRPHKERMYSVLLSRAARS
jgi:hypothetical protein